MGGLQKDHSRVVSNKGSCGVDGLEVDDLQEYLSTHQRDLVREILSGNYLPDAIRGVEIPKTNDERMIPKGECLNDIQKSEPLADGLPPLRNTHRSR